MQAQFTKLRSGDWGVKVSGGRPTFGDDVTVIKRNGSRKTVRIAKVVWQGDGAAICAIGQCSNGRSSKAAAASASRAAGHRACRECGGAVEHYSQGVDAGLCHDCC